jgi:hypothetical protein
MLLVLSGPSPAGFMITFYRLIFNTPPTWRARSPYLYLPGRGWCGYTPGHWVPFSSPATTRVATVKVSDPASTRDYFPSITQGTEYLIRHGPNRKHRVQQFSYCCVCIPCRGNVFTKPLPCNGRIFWLHYSGLLGGVTQTAGWSHEYNFIF